MFRRAEILASATVNSLEMETDLNYLTYLTVFSCTVQVAVHHARYTLH
jgi:hypothetical protein